MNACANTVAEMPFISWSLLLMVKFNLRDMCMRMDPLVNCLKTGHLCLLSVESERALSIMGLATKKMIF